MKAREDRLNESGNTDDDRVKAALSKWAAAHDGEDFKYLHCWRLLWGEPKWLNKVTGQGEGASKGKSPAGPSSSAQGTDSTLPADSGRPIGRDSAKKRRSSEQATAASNSACLEVLQDMHVSRKSVLEERTSRYERTFDVESKKIALKERLVQVQEEALLQQRHMFQFQIQEAQEAREDREERVMTMDLSMLNPEQRGYWKGRQAEILRRRKWTADTQ
ncbi:hypothetical protein BAE44_0019730 [Dichanthelium oligosanthes]|uniref:No apical meristem-associated C-terminal domain-containing protein n=1 Tax=Dichanthelium oligosanthes TaxID=888268 RepID=A0A1E5V2B0_9POAL|nr:hypothetical protein BAE44_0019730 [Dichanthelium oligosanthes]